MFRFRFFASCAFPLVPACCGRSGGRVGDTRRLCDKTAGAVLPLEPGPLRHRPLFPAAPASLAFYWGHFIISSGKTPGIRTLFPGGGAISCHTWGLPCRGGKTLSKFPSGAALGEGCGTVHYRQSHPAAPVLLRSVYFPAGLLVLSGAAKRGERAPARHRQPFLAVPVSFARRGAVCTLWHRVLPGAGYSTGGRSFRQRPLFPAAPVLFRPKMTTPSLAPKVGCGDGV